MTIFETLPASWLRLRTHHLRIHGDSPLLWVDGRKELILAPGAGSVVDREEHNRVDLRRAWLRALDTLVALPGWELDRAGTLPVKAGDTVDLTRWRCLQ